jgi:hypothetical protein
VMVADRRDQPDFVKVLDFGIAKVSEAHLGGGGLTQVGMVVGTPQYMAPEQATGTHLDERCDVYAVGVILYQMATGHLPFDGANSMEVLTKHVHERPVPPRQRQPDAPISEAMEALILRSLEKDAGKRPQTAEQFREELLAVPAKARSKRASLQAAEPLLRVPTPAQSPRIAPQPAPALGHPRRRLWLAGAFAAAAAIALFVKLRPEARLPQPITLTADTPVGPERDPERARELVLHAREKQAAGDAAFARDLLEQAIRVDPANAEAHFRLGGLFLETQPDRARREYEASGKLDPDRYAANVQTILNDMK